MLAETKYYELNKKFRLKYVLDRALACILLAAVSPVFLMVILVIKISGWCRPEDSGSVFYIEPRISAGKVFKIIKFRTISMKMVENIKNAAETKSITGASGITHSGRLILKWYLDEFPQLFNIAKGDISFVGPRPHIISHHALDIQSGMLYRDAVKAGLLGVPQACKKRPEYAAMLEKMMLKHKPCGRVISNLDNLYVNKCLGKSVLEILLFDAYIMVQGIIVVLLGKGK